MAPLVSVVLPCYNAVLAGYFREAVESVLAQSLNNFELIIIDDGSTDETWEAIKKLTDSRVRAYRQENAGLASTLNRAISYAKSTYIARQDQDDVMLPGRLEKQFKFMAQHPEVAGVGTWAEIMVGGDASARLHAFPTTHDALSFWLLFDNPFVHSSMLLRKDALLSVGGYCEDRSRQPPEDYELWSRLARKYRMANLGDILTAYREVPGSMSRAGENPFVRNLIRISAENLQHRFAGSFPLSACSGLARLYHGVLGDSKDRLGFFRFWAMVKELMLTNGASGDASLHYECRKVRCQIVRRLAYRFLLEQFHPTMRTGLQNIRGILGRFWARW